MPWHLKKSISNDNESNGVNRQETDLHSCCSITEWFTNAHKIKNHKPLNKLIYLTSSSPLNWKILWKMYVEFYWVKTTCAKNIPTPHPPTKKKTPYSPMFLLLWCQFPLTAVTDDLSCTIHSFFSVYLHILVTKWYQDVKRLALSSDVITEVISLSPSLFFLPSTKTYILRNYNLYFTVHKSLWP